MPRQSYRSLRYAVEGLAHAVSTERNLRHFTIIYTVVIIAGFAFSIGPWEWMALIGGGGAFVAVELINTAFERIVNAADELYKKQGRNHHHALKQTKDVGAAAALITLLTVGVITCMVFYPYVSAATRLLK